MKKLTSVFVVMMMIFCFVSVSYAGDLQKEFRGVKWGTSVISLLGNKNFYMSNPGEFKKHDENLTFGNQPVRVISYYINENRVFNQASIGLTDSIAASKIIDKVTGKKATPGTDGDGDLFWAWVDGKISIVIFPNLNAMSITYSNKTKKPAATF